jgi:hypothetical protein
VTSLNQLIVGKTVRHLPDIQIQFAEAQKKCLILILEKKYFNSFQNQLRFWDEYFVEIEVGKMAAAEND